MKNFNRIVKLKFLVLLLLMFSFGGFLIGCGGNDNESEENNNVKEEEKIVQEEEVKLYFMEDTGKEFVKNYEIREVDEVTPTQVMELFIEGPESNDLMGINETLGVELLGLEVEDGKAVVDFSAEFLDISLGHEAEHVFVDTIVYTLTEFQEIDEVQMLVEGEVADTISGHVNITESFTR